MFDRRAQARQQFKGGMSSDRLTYPGSKITARSAAHAGELEQSPDPDGEPDPYRDAGLTPEEAARLRAAVGRDTWVTRDGRELSIKQMYRPHLGNAQSVLTTWIKREKNAEKKRELKRWRSKMRRELAKREKAWQEKRRKQQEQEPSSEEPPSTGSSHPRRAARSSPRHDERS